MAVARAFRFLFDSVHARDGYCEVGEIEMMTSLTSADLCTGGTAIGSTTFGAGWEPDKAFDNNTGTAWSVTAVDTNRWVGYDFGVGVTKDVNAFTIMARPGVTNMGFTNFVVQTSPDASVWTTISTPYKPTPINGGKTLYELLADSNMLRPSQPETAWSVPGHISDYDLSKHIDENGAVIHVATAFWLGFPSAMRPVNGVIPVTVTEAGLPVKNARVLCMHRPTGLIVGSGWTNSAGQHTFTNLDPVTPATADEAEFCVIAFDPLGGALYNARIADRLIPTAV